MNLTQSSKRHSAGELFVLAKGCAAEGKLGQAEKFYRKAVALKPDFAEAHNNLGNILLNSDRLGEATLHFTRAKEAKPAVAMLHNNLGHALVSGPGAFSSSRCSRTTTPRRSRPGR